MNHLAFKFLWLASLKAASILSVFGKVLPLIKRADIVNTIVLWPPRHQRRAFPLIQNFHIRLWHQVSASVHSFVLQLVKQIIHLQATLYRLLETFIPD